MIRRFLSLVALTALVSGCACHTKKVNQEENIPVANSGGPLADINFAFDKSDLSETARSILSKNADYLKANPGVKTQIEGHCDERGTNEYNMALGHRRARSAESFLRGLGVDKKRMSTVSYGEELPLDPAHNEEAWAKNRRDHFKIESK